MVFFNSNQATVSRMVSLKRKISSTSAENALCIVLKLRFHKTNTPDSFLMAELLRVCWQLVFRLTQISKIKLNLYLISQGAYRFSHDVRDVRRSSQPDKEGLAARMIAYNYILLPATVPRLDGTAF